MNIINLIRSHGYLEAAVGYLLFFGGYLIVMIIATSIGDWLDQKFNKEKKE